MGASTVTWASQATVQEFATRPAWLNLLYYKASGKKHSSLVTRKEFFTAVNGRHSPSAELESMLGLLRQVKPGSDTHVQCLFPARYQLLRQHFDLPPPVDCTKFQLWYGRYAPTRLVLVYASQYVSNAASIFGHSFLLLPSEALPKAFWLTYNYAADMPQGTSGLGYIYGGITGWFTGDYSIMPYFQRIHQYGSIENRDLWLYEIRLEPEELEFILHHLWELVHTASFPYFFFDENCAGILLRTFAATLPDLQSAHRLPVYVHPMEVIQQLASANRIASVDLVPSQGSVLSSRLQSLQPRDQQQVRLAIRDPDLPLGNPPPQVSETLIHYLTYMTLQNSGELPVEFKPLERAAHIERAKHSDPPMEFPKEQALTQAPHLSHRSFMGYLGVSSLRQTTTADLSYRFAIHDRLDPDTGFLKYSSVEGAHVQLSATQKSLWLKDLTIARIDNFQPYSSFDPKASWRAKAAIVENLFTRSLADQYALGSVAYGLGAELMPNVLWYGLISTDLNLGANLSFPVWQLGPEMGFMGSWKTIRAHLTYAAGWGPVEGSHTEFARLQAGLGWHLHPRLTVTAESAWSRLLDRRQEGYRQSVGLRGYF